MSAAASKPSSYPSRQLRGGPAPLASFEDLSDEIDSPEENQLADIYNDRSAIDPLDLGDDTDECRTYSEGATPSTPRVLAQTPSTPLALDYDFSVAGTPDSLDRASISPRFGESGSRSDTPVTLRGAESVTTSRGGSLSESRGSLHSSPRASPLFGRRLKGAQLDSLQVGRHLSTTAAAATSSSENLGIQGATSVESVVSSRQGRSGPATPSPRSARKLFTMSFFKPRDDRSEKTPSPMLSPRSPRRLSPAASPKSPRKALAFANLFKSGGGGSGAKEEGDPKEQSPSKKRSHFPHFLRSTKEERKTQEVATPPGEPGRKESKHGARVFSTLFRREPKDASSTSKARTSQTPEDEEWIPPSKVQATAMKRNLESIPQEPTLRTSTGSSIDWSFPTHADASERTSRELVMPPAAARESLVSLNGERGQFESSHEISGELPEGCDPMLRLGFSPSASSTVETETVSDARIAADSLSVANAEVSSLPSEDDQLMPPASLTVDRKVSPESEAEIPELDPTVLKALKGEEPEAETLLREDSFENDEGPPELVALLLAAAKSNDKEVAKHKDKLAAFRPSPVDRPRCTAPVSIASLEAYIAVAQPVPACEEVTSPDRVKLKVILPGEEFGQKSRTKKQVYKSWFEFCEVGLQSPRSRRRQLGGSRSPSSVPASRETTIEEDERRTESLDFGFSPASWTTFDGTGEVRRPLPPPPQNGTSTVRHLPTCSSFHLSSSDSTPDDPYSPPPQIPPEECRCECHVTDVPDGGEPAVVTDSSPSSDGHSPKDTVPEHDAGVFLRDEEVEPLVGDGPEASEEFLVGQDSCLYTTAALNDSFSSFGPRRHEVPDYAIISDAVVPRDVSIVPVSISPRPPIVGQVNLGYGDEDDWVTNGIGGGETQAGVAPLPECVTSMILSDSVRGRELSSCSQHLDFVVSDESVRPGADEQPRLPPLPSRGQHWSNCGVDLLAALPSSPRPESGCPPLVTAHRGSRGPPPPPPPRSNLTALHHHIPARTTVTSTTSSTENEESTAIGSAPLP